MAAAKGKRPIIIKRVAAAAGGGHHGGAWKVAYADFVTAMMAFFLLMWLLNATTEKQRQGLADYFDPTIIQTMNGGQQGFDSGESIDPANPDATEPAAGADGQELAQIARDLHEQLTGTGAESMQRVNLLRHVVTRMTDEGLVIELGDIAQEPLFVGDTADPTPVLRDLTEILGPILGRVRNDVALAGHVRGFPEMMINSPVWSLSDGRAQVVRELLSESMAPRRIKRVTAWGDRRNLTANAMDPANNRIEVILLR
ncbi:MAG: chemotaxis protein MotB [Paracoccus denitrificans]|nr:MAG: chemotaxis protein MotB [Paracoccus denitrificans]PZO85830.1 MAG: chemotaxis protein MotB [Paracoccus denitrificans]